MSRNPFIIAITVALSALTFSSPDLLAQMRPGQGGTAGPRPIDNAADGVAEQAPKKLGALPTTPVLPPPKDSYKKLQVFSLEGYFRTRVDWMKQMNLGFTDDESIGGAPFPTPLACRENAVKGGCEDSFGSANTRLRLEPIIHLDERSTVHMQIDVLDNLVLGTTHADQGNEGEIPTGILSDNQRPQEAGVNSLGDSIVVKRAWAEIHSPLGVLKFGRMPWHWGMGLYANGGGQDPIHGTYNLDADLGDTVDRVSLSANIPGTNLNAGLGIDWSQTGPTAISAGEQAGRGRQTWDLDDADDLDQWLFTISRMDSPTQIADTIADGGFILNYGGFMAYRVQDYSQVKAEFGTTPPTDEFIQRDFKVYIPNAWIHFAKGPFDIEAEAVAVLGSMSATDLGLADDVGIRLFGGVAKMSYKLMDDDLTLKFETGFASGDRHRNKIAGRTHVSNSVALGAGDNTLQQFMFDGDYHVDLILFRELLGTVSNAIYTKPSATYDLNSKFQIKGAGILSFAHRTEATPGGSRFYGLEFDGDIGYHNDGFYAGIAYGILLPLGAMDHPANPTDGSAGAGFGTIGRDASIAQTLQTRLSLSF